MAVYLWALGLVLFNTAAAGLNLLGLPGNWLMIAATALVAWINSSKGMIGPGVIIIIIVLAVAGELIEFLSGFLAARGGGAGRRGSWGALLGGIAGGIIGTFTIPIPLFGSLLGVAAGACAGAILAETSGGTVVRRAVNAGMWAGAGSCMGTFTKLLLGIVIWAVVAIAAFWP